VKTENVSGLLFAILYQLGQPNLIDGTIDPEVHDDNKQQNHLLKQL